MSFERPTLEEIIDRVRGDIKAELGITTILRRSFVAAISRAVAGAAHLLHGHIVFASKQIFPDVAEDEFAERWGSIYGVERKAATFTVLTVVGTGTNGTLLAQGTQFQTPAGVLYATQADVTVALGAYSVNIKAVDAGSASNLDNGEIVNLVSPVAGIDASATVNATVTEGEDVESDEDYRGRIVNRIQQPPSGGKASDYIGFILDGVPGATRAWVFPGYRGQGTVDVAFVEDNEDPIFPSTAKIAEAQSVIDEEKPVTADSVVFAPQEKQVDITVDIKPNTQAVRDAITAELQGLFRRDAQVAGSYKQVGETNDGSILLSRINEAISIAEGEEDHVVISPTSDVTALTPQLCTLGTITFGTLV